MRLQLDGLEVLWPYDYIYPEQLQYMRLLKQSLERGHCLLEMPTGTGKTVSLLSLILSFQYAHPEVGKLIYCFPQSCTRILTNHGFLFIDQIQSLLAAGKQVLYAAYNKTSRPNAPADTLVYVEGAIVEPPPNNEPLISFASTVEQQRWGSESDEYGRIAGAAAIADVEDHDDDTDVDEEKESSASSRAPRPSSNRVSLLVTPEHRMYVQLGNEDVRGRKAWQRTGVQSDIAPPAFIPAADLIEPECTCRDGVRCEHRVKYLRFVASATAGVAWTDSPTGSIPADVCKRLGLHTPEQQDAFLELYGVWLGDGTMQYRTPNGGYDSVVFVQRKQDDIAWLHATLGKVGLASYEWRSYNTGNNTTMFYITAQRWFAEFNAEYGCKYQTSSSSSDRPDSTVAITPTKFDSTASSSIASHTTLTYGKGGAKRKSERSAEELSNTSPSFRPPTSDLSCPRCPMVFAAAKYSRLAKQKRALQVHLDKHTNADAASATRRSKLTELSTSSSSSASASSSSAVAASAAAPLYETPMPDDEVNEMLTANARMMAEMREKRQQEHESQPSIKSAKWFFGWVLKRLGKRALRLIIEGMRRADGHWKRTRKQEDASSSSSAAAASPPSGCNVIYTSSVEMRDSLVVALLHAGYTAAFSLQYSAGTVHGYYTSTDPTIRASAQECTGGGEVREVKANADSWRVRYVEVAQGLASGAVRPNLHRQTGVKVVPAQGATWCVKLQHPDQILVAQRARRNKNGIVTQASRPILAGNCTRTVQEMDKVVEELRRVVAFRTKIINEDVADEMRKGNTQHSIRSPAILGVCLSSRRNLCLHPEVSKHDNRARVDALCRIRTASFVREQKAAGADVEVCSFYEGYEKEGKEATVTGIYGLSELKALGAERGWCPYFTSRHLVTIANVVVYNYQYLLDPKIATLVSRDMQRESIVVFDEAHNIDNICIEALSCEITKRQVSAASSNVNKLSHAVTRMEKTDNRRLQEEYKNLVEGLSSSFGGLGDRDDGGSSAAAASSSSTSSRSRARGGGAIETDLLLASPVLPQDILRESVPGNIRRAHHFLMFLRGWVEFLRKQLRVQSVSQRSTDAFLEELRQEVKTTDLRAMKFAYDRLQSLFQTLKITDMEEYGPLTNVVNFATMAAMYKEGFTIIFEPYDERTPSIPDPKLQLCCLEASYAIKPVFERFRSVVITSGTLSPLDVYPKMLNFTPAIAESLTMSLTRNCICPMIVTKGSDQVPITSSYDLRSDVGVLQNYGRLLIDLCATVPDGIIAFFTSYKFLEDMVAAWKESGVLDDVLKHKLIFIETKDIVETTLALDAYKRACNHGRGAVFFSVARGKVAEGIDFDRHYGRAVIMFGIPFQYTLSRVLRARLTYLRERHQLSEADFLSFDALRQTSQCVGRVIRSKMDYGLMIFADARFQRSDKRSKLPAWITNYLDKTHLNLSTDRAVAIAKEFLKAMAQPRSKKEEIGTTMLDEARVKRIMQEMDRERAEREGRMEEEKEEARMSGGFTAAKPTSTLVPTSNSQFTLQSGIPRPPPQPWTVTASAAHSNTFTIRVAPSSSTSSSPPSGTVDGSSAATAMEID